MVRDGARWCARARAARAGCGGAEHDESEDTRATEWPLDIPLSARPPRRVPALAHGGRAEGAAAPHPAGMPPPPPPPCPAARTYVALAWGGGILRASRPLGTVIAQSRHAARALAALRWPAAGDRLRLVTAAGAPADVLGRALALDGRAQISG